ncbi:MAG: DUF3047 domain-containing protein [Solirubrobacteraceae bacterium]
MNAPVSLRRVGTLAGAIADQLRAPAPAAAALLDLASAAAALRGVGADVALVHINGRSDPWTPAGLFVKQGAAITWLADGDSWIATQRGPHLDPALQLRVRTGACAPALDGTGPTFTSAAPHEGPLELCSLFPGELRDAGERVCYDRKMPRALFRGGFDVVVAAWPSGSDVGARLAEAAARDPTGLCGRELERIRAPIAPPSGWEPHIHVPLAGLHRRREGEVDVQCRGRAEIVCREARAPLTETLKLRWRWRMDQLPAKRAEDTLFTHDYMSVAVEFDDGRDLSYHWSVALPNETSYRCPLPHWREREWHLVVRSGRTGLGEWHAEERTVAIDRAVAIGGTVPREVVRVWLIVTCLSVGGEARGSYADIELTDDNGTAIRVL